jgi:HAD superfamily hydrolase (TIGR01509 family)
MSTLPAAELETVALRWEAALDAAQRAVGDAGGHFGLPAAELTRRRGELVAERRSTARLLGQLARETGVPAPWMPSIPLTPRMLGLDEGTTVCLFDLDRVLTDSAAVHAAAWTEVFNAFLLRLGEEADRRFRPFDARRDYREFVDGRTRLEAVHAFLDSRGVHLAEGRPSDAPGAPTAWALANRKGDLVARMMHGRGVAALPGARRYLEACGYAGLTRAVVSASANTHSMLELAQLSPLLDAGVDAAVMKVENLRSRPAPDVLLAVCRRLGREPAEAVSFTHSPAGVVAAHAAGVAVIGVADAADAELLRAYGAERVVPSLATMLVVS